MISNKMCFVLHCFYDSMFFDGFSSAAGTLLLSKFVAQEVYDDHINESHGDPGAASTGEENFKCFGTECVSAPQLYLFLVQ